MYHIYKRKAEPNGYSRGCVATSVLAINGRESRSAICVGAKGMSGTILEYYSRGAVSSTTDTCMC